MTDYPVRWVDFGQPRLELVVPQWYEEMCAERGTTPQEVYDSGLGPPCNVVVCQPFDAEPPPEPTALARLAEKCADEARRRGVMA